MLIETTNSLEKKRNKDKSIEKIYKPIDEPSSTTLDETNSTTLDDPNSTTLDNDVPMLDLEMIN